MKKTSLLFAIILTVVLLASCRNVREAGPVPAGSSFVTITVGSNHTAKISVEKATLFAKLRNFLRGRFEVSSAMAAIPTNVFRIQFTAKAGDMETITSSVDAAGMPSVTVTIEVPNGLKREFVVAAFDDIGNYVYWGRAYADLFGAPVSLPVKMINLGSVSSIVWVSPAGDDATGDGSEAKPYRSISYALGAGNPNEGVFVEAGVYDVYSGEFFPLWLNPGTALICLGPNYSTVIDDIDNADASGTEAMIMGEDAAYIDGCKILASSQNFPSYWTSAIDDAGLTIHVNNTYVDGTLAPMSGCYDTNQGVLLSGNSSFTNSKVTGFAGCEGGGHGITVDGDALVSGNTFFTNNDAGIYIGYLSTTGSPTISNNTITNNNAGIYNYSTGSPSISNNTITANQQGISLFAGTAPIIDGNTVTDNSSTGIYTWDPAVAMNPIITNNVVTGNLSDGMLLYHNTGTISGNMVSNNGGDGVNLTQTSGTVSGNTISNNTGNGMYLNQPSGTVSGNTIRGNAGYGLYAASVIKTTPPISTTSIQNNIFSCNSLADFYLMDSLAGVFDIPANAWDHDASTIPAGPTIVIDSTPCPGGTDICYSSALTATPPTASTINTAVAGGCL